MRSLFQFNTAELKSFIQQIKAEHSELLADKSKQYNFDFVEEKPLNESMKIQLSTAKPRFNWEPIKLTKKTRHSLQNPTPFTSDKNTCLTGRMGLNNEERKLKRQRFKSEILRKL